MTTEKVLIEARRQVDASRNRIARQVNMNGGVTVKQILESITGIVDDDGYIDARSNREFLDDIFDCVFKALDSHPDFTGDRAAGIASTARGLALMEILKSNEAA